jgi:hypothetical protein
MSEWQVRKGNATAHPVTLARDREVLEYEFDGRPFVFACEVVPNEREGRGVAVMMHLAERTDLRQPIALCELAASFDADELPQELDLATIVTCRSRAEWLFASAADQIEGAHS